MEVALSSSAAILTICFDVVHSLCTICDIDLDFVYACSRIYTFQHKSMCRRSHTTYTDTVTFQNNWAKVLFSLSIGSDFSGMYYSFN